VAKNIFFTGQPVLSQLLSLIPAHFVDSVARQHSADRYCKRFMTRDHLVTMLYASLFKVTSLRELITGLQANSSRLFHVGLKHTPRRSTVAEANSRRPAAVFEQLYHRLYQHYYGLPDSRSKKQRLFILDSTTVPLFSSVMQGAGSYRMDGRKKGGLKAHTVMDADNQVPAFVCITEGRCHDLTLFSALKMTLPPGSTVVMDKAYIKHSQFQQWDDHGVRWVTRKKNDASYSVMQAFGVDEESQQNGVLADQRIELGRPSNQRITPVIQVRHIVFKDRENNRLFDFITNDFDCRPEEIAQIYRRRWDIELMFKRIKQAYPLRYFLGDTPNAIQIQVWCALICDLLINVVRKNVNQTGVKRWSYANLAAMIRHHLMTYVNLSAFLLNPEKALINYHPPDSRQLRLFKQGGL
jgi:hypothetical protein